MVLSRQSDHTRNAVVARALAWKRIIPIIFKKRREDPASTFSSNRLFLIVANNLLRKFGEYNFQLRRPLRISLTSFDDNRFPFMSDDVLLSLFRFRRDDIMRVVEVMSWPLNRKRTKHNRYSVTPLLATCVVLRRLASATRWRDLEQIFGGHKSQLSEIFWEALMVFVSERVGLVMDIVCAPFWSGLYSGYANAVYCKSNALENVVAFIHGTNLKIARPSGDHILQRVAYNGHKRSRAIKFQAPTTPCGMCMHLAGPMEKRRHDWTLYMSSGLNNTLQQAFFYDGKQFVAFGDSGYSARCFLYVPFSGSNLCEARSALNKAMAKSRAVEWFFIEVKRYWTLVDFKRKMRVRESAVGAMYIAAVILTNVWNCCYPNTISQ